MTNDYYPFVNTPLPYSFDALEPYIDAKTMQLHHDNHLGTYIDNLNKILKTEPQLQKMSLQELVANVNRLPRTVREPIKNNAGGVYNHRLYFESLTPQTGQKPAGALMAAIHQSFGSFEKFTQEMKEKGLAVFGSGYAWLGCPRDGRLRIVTTANQDTPLPLGVTPLLNLDVWEHAYYLKHYNKRADYIDDWHQVIDWQLVARRYADCARARRRGAEAAGGFLNLRPGV